MTPNNFIRFFDFSARLNFYRVGFFIISLPFTFLPRIFLQWRSGGNRASAVLRQEGGKVALWRVKPDSECQGIQMLPNWGGA